MHSIIGTYGLNLYAQLLLFQRGTRILRFGDDETNEKREKAKVRRGKSGRESDANEKNRKICSALLTRFFKLIKQEYRNCSPFREENFSSPTHRPARRCSRARYTNDA